MQPTTLIKIEDSGGTTTTSAAAHHHHHHHHQSSLFDPCKTSSIQTSTITAAVQTNEMSPNIPSHHHHHQMYFESDGNLIQISPHIPHTTTISDESSENIPSPQQVSPTEQPNSEPDHFTNDDDGPNGI